MNDDPLDRLPTFNRVSIRAVLVHDGEDPGEALAEAGIINPIAIPVVLGESLDLSGGILGDGITPNLTGVLETEHQDAFTASPGTRVAERQTVPDQANSPRWGTAMLPAAFGMQPLAPVRRSGDVGRVADGAPALLRKLNPISPADAGEPRGHAASGQPVNIASHNPSNINRFFDQPYSPLSRLAQDLGLPESYLLGLSAYESGHYDDHNLSLKNPFGLTKGGKDNIQFKSVDEAVSYWKSQYGDQVRGATSAADFAQRLEGILDGKPVVGWHRYNSKNLEWERQMAATIRSIDHRKELWKAGQ